MLHDYDAVIDGRMTPFDVDIIEASALHGLDFRPTVDAGQVGGVGRALRERFDPVHQGIRAPVEHAHREGGKHARETDCPYGAFDLVLPVTIWIHGASSLHEMSENGPIIIA